MSDRNWDHEGPEAIQQELVAYLDGELSPEDSARIERRLAEDATYRQELQRLERAWDMLEALPRAEVEDSFTRSTVEMIAVRATEDVETGKDQHRRRTRLMWLVGSAGFLAAALIGYLVVASVAARPNRQLVQDLPIVENLDAYRYADSLAFLQMLEQEGLFPEELPVDATPIAAHEPLAERERRLAGMPAPAKETLRQQKARFEGLSSSQQQSLRDLHAQIMSAPNREQLLILVRNYSEWLRTLPSGQRAELLSLNREDRIEQIRSLLKEQECQRMERFVGELARRGDIEALYDWMDEFVQSREQIIYQLLPLDRLPPKLEWLKQRAPHRRLVPMYFELFDQHAERGEPLPETLLPSDADIAKLASRLSSEEARQLLHRDENRDRQRQMQLVLNWMRAAWISRFNRIRESMDLTEEKLQDFYQNHLDAKDREYLSTLPSERMQQELERWYIFHEMRKRRHVPANHGERAGETRKDESSDGSRSRAEENRDASRCE